MTDTNEATTPPTPPPAKLKRPHRWRRRFLWTATVLLVVGVFLRVVLPLSLPMVLQKIAGIYGMNCSYDRLELNMFSGDAGIWGLAFKPKEGGEPVFAADYCHGNLSVLNLFRGRLDVWRVEADGVDVNIDRNADGHIPLLDRIVAASNSGTTAPVTIAPATKPSNTKPGEIDLSSPLRVDALRLGHIRVHFRDKGVTPELDTELAMDLRLSDLGSPSQPAKFEMNLSMDPMLDTMKVTGEGRSAGKMLDASLHVLVRGIHLKPAAPYLAPLGIRPIGDSITLRADGKVHTAAAPGNAQGFTGSIAFDNLSASVDQHEAMALDHLRIDADTIDTRSIHLARIDFDGARATGGRGTDGNIRVLGIEYDPTLVPKTPPTIKPAAPVSPPPPFLTSLIAEPWSLGEVALRNARLDLHDQAMTPAVDLSLITDELSAKSIVHDPQNLNTVVKLTGLLHSPGMVDEIKLNGSATPFSDIKTLKAAVTASGIKLSAIKPYLDQIGIETTLKDGQFAAAMETSVVLGDTITANAKVTKFDFHDDKPLLSLNGIKVSDVTLNSKTGDISIAAIELSGPGISVLRDHAGQLSALGFRTRASNPQAGADVPRMPASPAITTQPSPPAAAPAFDLASLPKVTLKKFSWKDIRVDLEDQGVEPASKISLSDIGVEASDLSTDLKNTTRGSFRAWLESPQVAKKLAVEGYLIPSAKGIEFAAGVTGAGLNLTPFATYLQPFGVEPVLHDGSVAMDIGGHLSISGISPSITIELSKIKYSDGIADIASVDAVMIDNVKLTDNVIGVDRISIDHPHARAKRDADGSIVAGGFRVLAPPKANADPVAPMPAVVVAPSIAPATMPASTPIVISLPSIEITDAGIDWDDVAVHPSVSTSADVTLSLLGLTIGKEAEPAALRLNAHVLGSVDNIVVTGKINAGPSRQSAGFDVAMSGIRAGRLASYLPPGVWCALENGQFSSKVNVALSQNPAGGIGAELIAGPLDFRDQGQAMPLFHLDAARVIMPRIDLPENALAVDEISVAGVETHAERLKDGGLACMGMVLRSDAGGSVGTTDPAKILAAEAASPVILSSPVNHSSPVNPSSPVSPAVSAPTTGPSLKDLLALAHRSLPVVTVDKLDLDVSKVTLTDLYRPESLPLVVSDLRLHNVNRIDWLGKDYAAKPPTHLQFECKVAPLIDRVLVDAMVSPFARQPNLQVDFSATGVHGHGLTDLVPELKSQVDGASMENGTIGAHLEAEAKLDRHSPIDFDISHEFDLSFLINKVAYRASPDGPVLAGVDEVRSEGIHIDPSTSFVHFKTVEITKPTGLLTQDAKGIHALGWIYNISATQQTPTTQVAVIPAPASTPVKPIDAAQTPAPPTGEVRIDKLLISGLDFCVEDNAVDPPLVIPLNGLDVEVRNISTLAPYQDKPMRFSAIVNAGKVKLARRGSSPVMFEDRDLFSQITANGEVSLYPRLHGWAKTSVSAFDMAALQGAAKAFKEDLTAGTYDMSIDLRFDPTGAIAIDSRYILTDLLLSEPSDGFIVKSLHLPPPFDKTPLDQVIGAVQGTDGSIALPIKVTLDPKHLSYADLGLSAAGGVSQVIVTALAAEPLKAVNGVGSMIGFGGSKQPVDLTTVVRFSPGSPVIGAGGTTSVESLLSKLRSDPSLAVTLKGQLGTGDIKISSTRANPTVEQSTSLELQLRNRKADLLQLRAQAAGKARAQLVTSGAQGADSTLQQLRAIDRELEATEESLDQMGDLLRPGAEKQADRRTKAAALQLAGDRIDELKSTLRAAGIADDRIKSVSPQFNPTDDLDGGEIVISVVEKK